MARKIIFPIIIFLTLLAAANVRSLPLLVLAYAEIIFAGLMIALALFQRSRIKTEPARKFVSLDKDHPYDCTIRVDNSSPFPVSRFRLNLTHGYDDTGEPVALFGGTDRSGGYLKVHLENEHCGINKVTLKKIKCYDAFLLSSFSKKLDKTMQIAVFPDEKLNIRIIPRYVNVTASDDPDTDLPYSMRNGGTEPEDIRPYREGDPVRNIYWKQSAKMNELWVKELKEEVQTLPVLEVPVTGVTGLDYEYSDAFYRIFYAMMSGVFDISGRFILRCTGKNGVYRDYRITDIKQCRLILICFYKNDLTSLNEYFEERDVSPAFMLGMEPDKLSITKDKEPIKTFDPSVSDDEICETVIIV